MEELCEVLGNISEKEAGEGEGGGDHELSTFTQALKKLLLELPDKEETVVLAKVLVMAAGHIGLHYWTNALNRQLAKG